MIGFKISLPSKFEGNTIVKHIPYDNIHIYPSYPNIIINKFMLDKCFEKYLLTSSIRTKTYITDQDWDQYLEEYPNKPKYHTKIILKVKNLYINTSVQIYVRQIWNLYWWTKSKFLVHREWHWLTTCFNVLRSKLHRYICSIKTYLYPNKLK